MASDVINTLRHRKERRYGTLMMVVGAAVWLLVILATASAVYQGTYAVLGIYVLYGALFWAFGMLSAAFYRAYAFGHFVMVTPEQLPHLHQMVAEGAAEIGLAQAPTAFVYNSNGLINAFARRLLGGRYVFLTSSLIDADTDAQVRFVIGHELGHHAAGHLDWRKNLLKLPAHFIPLLAPAYSRGRELTCDRVGAYLARDMDSSRGALQMLGCGSARLNALLNPAAFEAQERLVPPFFGWLLHVFSGYPRITQRVAALSDMPLPHGEPLHAAQ